MFNCRVRNAIKIFQRSEELCGVTHHNRLIEMLPDAPNTVAPLLGDIRSDAISAVPILNKLYFLDKIGFYYIEHLTILESLQKIALSTSNKVKSLSNNELNIAISYFSLVMKLRESRKLYSLGNEFKSIQTSLSILKKEYNGRTRRSSSR